MTIQELIKYNPNDIKAINFEDGTRYELEQGYAFDIGEDAGETFGLSLHVWDSNPPACWIPCGMWTSELITSIELNNNEK